MGSLPSTGSQRDLYFIALLILYIDRAGLLRQYFLRRQQAAIRFADIILIKQFKAGELYGFIGDIEFVAIVFEGRFAPAVHIHNDLYVGMDTDILIIRDHWV